jgi:L-ascorbate metabolism protein UlaG (beta-lactamase superfamily)
MRTTMKRTLMKRVGTALLFLAVALCFAPSLVPPFLDRIYYRGPPSDHYDGERFFNPGFEAYRGGNPRLFLNRWLSGGRAQWPARVPVRQTVPAAQVEGEEMRVTWIGHATVLIQTQGLNILTDPVWAERASPFPFVGPKRVRAPGVRFEDLPKIDLVLISHNHYDHLDLATLKRLWTRDRPQIVTSLGNDAILRGRGVDAVALDWNQEAPFKAGAVTVQRNHHWSSRWGTDRNRALWSAFTVRLPGGAIFYTGDTGYGDGSWQKEAARNGPFRLAIIPIGAYEPRDFMKTNHVNPEEAVRVFEALDPGMALGVHWGTFQLTFEPIDEPRQRLEALKRSHGIAPGRFIAAEAGQGFSVPPLRQRAAPAAAARRGGSGSGAGSPSGSSRRRWTL